MSALAACDRLRHRIPFWWWLTYDALVGVVIVVGIAPSDPAFWLGFAVLSIAVVIDVAEFAVKRPRLTSGSEPRRVADVQAADHREDCKPARGTAT